jgi:hypothetical protein
MAVFQKGKSIIHLSREETRVILSIKNFLCFRKEEEEKNFVNFTLSVSVSVRMQKMQKG